MIKNFYKPNVTNISNLLFILFIVITIKSQNFPNGNSDEFHTVSITADPANGVSSPVSNNLSKNKFTGKDYSYSGKMEATVITHKAYPNFKNPEEETIIEEKFFSYMGMKCSPGSIRKLKSHDFRANILTQGLEYPIFWGKTSTDHVFEPMKVSTDIHTKTYNKVFGEFLLYSDIIVNGESNGYDWNFSIIPFARAGTGIQSIDGTAQYCVKLYMSGNIRLHSDPKYKTVGTVTGKERISEDEFEPISTIVSEDNYLGLAQCDCDKEVRQDDRVVIPLIVEAPRQLEDFLLNPTDHYTMELSGKFYTFEEGYEEIEKTVKVKITVFYVVQESN